MSCYTVSGQAVKGAGRGGKKKVPSDAYLFGTFYMLGGRMIRALVAIPMYVVLYRKVIEYRCARQMV